MSCRLLEVPVPAGPDAPDAALLHGYVEAVNASLVDTWGTTDFEITFRQMLGSLRDQTYTRKHRLVAVDDAERVVGVARLDLPLRDNTHTGGVTIFVRPGERGQGVGSALHDEVVRIARAAGRSMLMISTDQRVEPPERTATLAPSTGAGRVDGDDPSVRFAIARGWQLEQVGRRSVLEVPVDPGALAAHRAAAEQAAGSDYRVLLWGERCPDELLDQFAVLNTRMSTDAPTGGLEIEEDRWDGARVRVAEQSFRDRGLDLLVAAAEHVPTGTLAAYTVFLAPDHLPEVVEQEDTLVLREHRGRRLGMLVKAANLQRLALERPATRRISTWNAEENRYMLDINVALGFRPAGGAGEWQRRLVEVDRADEPGRP